MMTSYGKEDMVRLANQINLLLEAIVILNGNMRIVSIGTDKDEPSFLNCVAIRYDKDGSIIDWVYATSLIQLTVSDRVGRTCWCNGHYLLTKEEAMSIFYKECDHIIWEDRI